jgi:hypothetical protein
MTYFVGNILVAFLQTFLLTVFASKIEITSEYIFLNSASKRANNKSKTLFRYSQFCTCESCTNKETYPSLSLHLYLTSSRHFPWGWPGLCLCENKSRCCSVSKNHARTSALLCADFSTDASAALNSKFNYNRRLDNNINRSLKAAGLGQLFVEVSSLSAGTNRSYLYKKYSGVHTLCHTPQWCIH